MREEIIRMAREAGFGIAAFNAIDGYEVVTSDGKIITDEIERFAALVAAAKKEECAKVCEDLRKAAVMSKYATYSECMQIRNTHSDCAAAIRAL